MWKAFILCFINPFWANLLLLYPLQKIRDLCFSDTFRGYQKRTSPWHGLIIVGDQHWKVISSCFSNIYVCLRGFLLDPSFQMKVSLIKRCPETNLEHHGSVRCYQKGHFLVLFSQKWELNFQRTGLSVPKLDAVLI